ncbi:MAG TPA: hypothetical protein VII06_00080 [Chloroflexota bacterium]
MRGLAPAIALALGLLLAASGAGTAQTLGSDGEPLFAQSVAAQAATAAPAPASAAGAGQPRFANLGPGQPAPDVEGPPRATSVMPPNRTQRCRWDLAGAWEGRGQQTDPSSNSYNTRLVVQQFGNFLVAQQPADSLAYYGVCSGDRVEFDAYSGDGTYIGVQTGTVSSNGRRIESTWVLYRPDYAAGYETLTASGRPSR